MNRNDFDKLLQNYPRFVLKKDLTEKQIQNAFKHIIPGVKEDDFIALYDAGILKNGKKGVALTTHAMYYGLNSEKITYADLVKVKYSAKNAVTSAFAFVYTDGKSEQHTISYPDASELASVMLEISRAIFDEKQALLDQTEGND